MAKSQISNLKSPGFRSAAGFSMVEVLVASTILVVIVMMLGMLFQQTSLAWRTGQRRADSYKGLRTIIGAFQRDASAAVDEESIPKELRDKIGGSQKLDGLPLAFYTLRGTYFGNDDKDNPARRALTYVTYSSSGKRTEEILLADGKVETRESDLLDTETRKSMSINGIYPGPIPAGSTFPLYLTVEVEVTPKGNAAEIGAWSYGRDGTPNTKDDIKTWVEE